MKTGKGGLLVALFDFPHLIPISAASLFNQALAAKINNAGTYALTQYYECGFVGF